MTYCKLNSCCGIPLFIGTAMIAVLYGVLATSQVIALVLSGKFNWTSLGQLDEYNDTSLDVTDNSTLMADGTSASTMLDEFFKEYLDCHFRSLVLPIAITLSSILLMVAVLDKSKPNFAIPWLVFEILGTINVIILVLAFTKRFCPSDQCPMYGVVPFTFLFLAIDCGSWLVVYSYYRELKEENSSDGSCQLYSVLQKP